MRRRPRKHTSQQRLSVPAGRGKDSRDTAKRGNSGQPPGLLQRAKNQPVVPHPDAVPSPVLDTGSPPTSHSCHPRAKRRIPRPSHPTVIPPTRRAGPRSGTHGGARDGRGYPQNPSTQPHPTRSPTTHIGAVRERPWCGARLQPPAPHSQPAFSQPVVPDPHTSSSPTPIGDHVGRAARGQPTYFSMSSSSEAKDLPAIPQPHSPSTQPPMATTRRTAPPHLVFPDPDRGPRWTGCACTAHLFSMSSSSEAKDLPAIPQPHSPSTQPPWPQPVVPHPHTSSSPTPIGDHGGRAARVQPTYSACHPRAKRRTSRPKQVAVHTPSGFLRNDSPPDQPRDPPSPKSHSPANP